MKSRAVLLVALLAFGQMAPHIAEAAWVDNVPASHRVWLKTVDPQYKTWRSNEERPWIPAVVRRVELAKSALTITHGPIQQPAMKAMTMRLPITDRSHAEMLKPNDQVEIQAADIGGRVRIVNVRMRH